MIELFSDIECIVPFKGFGLADYEVSKELVIHIRNSSSSAKYSLKISLKFPNMVIVGNIPSMIRPLEVLPLNILWTPIDIDWMPEEEYRVLTGELIVIRKITETEI